MSLVLHIDAEYGNVDLVGNGITPTAFSSPIVETCKGKSFFNGIGSRLYRFTTTPFNCKTLEFAFNWNNSSYPTSTLFQLNGTLTNLLRMVASGSSFTITNFPNNTLYVNYNEGNNIIAGKWYHVVITADINSLTELRSMIAVSGYITYIKLYDHTLSLQEIETAYKQWLNKKNMTKPIYYKYKQNPSTDGKFKNYPSMVMDFSNYGADGIAKNAFKGMFASGTFNITRENNRNVLNRSTSNVYLSVPYYKLQSKFEWEVFKPSTTSSVIVYLGKDIIYISTSSSYLISLTNNNVFSFQKRLNGVTTVSYTGTTQYSTTDWHKIKVEIDSSNNVKCYVNNNLEYSFTDATPHIMNYAMFSSASVGAKWADLRAYESI